MNKFSHMQYLVIIMSSNSRERGTDLHQRDLIAAAQHFVLFKMSIPKHKIIAAKGTAKGGRISKDLVHKQGGGVQGREQKTIRMKIYTLYITIFAHT